jgi:hypothetical protein
MLVEVVVLQMHRVMLVELVVTAAVAQAVHLVQVRQPQVLQIPAVVVVEIGLMLV